MESVWCVEVDCDGLFYMGSGKPPDKVMFQAELPRKACGSLVGERAFQAREQKVQMLWLRAGHALFNLRGWGDKCSWSRVTEGTCQ